MTESTQQETTLPWYTKSWNTLKTFHPAWLIVIGLIILQGFTICYYEGLLSINRLHGENMRSFSRDNMFERNEGNKMNHSRFQNMQMQREERMNMRMPGRFDESRMYQNNTEMNAPIPEGMNPEQGKMGEITKPTMTGTGKNMTTPPQPMQTQTKSGIIVPQTNK